MVTLAIESNGGSELTYNLSKQSITLGASSQCDVVLRTPGVAPRHVVIQRNGAVYTFVAQQRQVVVLNGERRSRGVLRVGDRLRIGSATVVLKGLGEDEVDVETTRVEDAQAPAADRPTPVAPRARTPSGKMRSEVVLYSEPQRIASARQLMVDMFRGRLDADLVGPLGSLLERLFPDRQVMVAVLDPDGRFAPVISRWSTDLPRFPERTFAEVESGRFAVVRLGARRILVYPVARTGISPAAFVVLELPEGEEWDDDRLLLAELARMLEVNWERLERSSRLYGPWEGEARQRIEDELAGTSNGIRVLRDQMMSALRSSSPLLVSGRPGSGRMFVATLIAELHPSGPLGVHAFQAQEDEEEPQRMELFGEPGHPDGASGLIERASGGVLVLRDVHLLPASLQRELTAAIRSDRQHGFGPRVRWIATTDDAPMTLVSEGQLDAALYGLFDLQLRLPAIDERREDLPLLVVRMLESLGAEQGKEIRGIELETLNSLLNHPFDGQMTELIAELRRLVTATPSGEMVRGVVPIGSPAAFGETVGEGDGPALAILARDDLKEVIPFVEHLIIDRVLRRTKGNQSKAARILNLSRGALIAKMKEYEVPDYRYLRRRG